MGAEHRIFISLGSKVLWQLLCILVNYYQDMVHKDMFLLYIANAASRL